MNKDMMIIGKEYIGVSAGAVVYNAEGRIFLAQRSEGARDDVGMWEFPGGSVRFAESREEAVKRLMREKYDLEVSIREVLGAYDVIDGKEQDHWVSTTYICDLMHGEGRILIPEKCQKIGWFSRGEITLLPLSRITKLNLQDMTS